MDTFKQVESAAADELFEDFKEFGFGDLAVSVFVDGSDELVDFLDRNLSVPAQALEGVVDELEDLVLLESSAVVGVVLIKDGVNCLS